MNSRNAALVGLAFTAISTTAHAVPNLVTNGSFEADNFTGVFVTLPPAPTGWTIDSGTIDGIGGYWQAAAGTTNSIDLFGNSRGKISQSIATVVGQTYAVTYYQSYNPDSSDPSVALLLDITGVSLGTVSSSSPLTFSLSHTRADMQWQIVSTSFVAQDTLTKLSFSSTSANKDNVVYGAALDEVSVSAVPLPGVLGLMLVGLVGMGVFRKRI